MKRIRDIAVILVTLLCVTGCAQGGADNESNPNILVAEAEETDIWGIGSKTLEDIGGDDYLHEQEKIAEQEEEIARREEEYRRQLEEQRRLEEQQRKQSGTSGGVSAGDPDCDHNWRSNRGHLVKEIEKETKEEYYPDGSLKSSKTETYAVCYDIYYDECGKCGATRITTKVGPWRCDSHANGSVGQIY